MVFGAGLVQLSQDSSANDLLPSNQPMADVLDAMSKAWNSGCHVTMLTVYIQPRIVSVRTILGMPKIYKIQFYTVYIQ